MAGLSSDAVWEILSWLDDRAPWQWLVLLLAAHYDLRRPLPLMSPNELLDKPSREAFAVAKYGEWGAASEDRYALLAASLGHLRAFRRRACRTQQFMRWAMTVAASHGRSEIMRQLREWGAKDFGHAKDGAALGRQVEATQLLEVWELGLSRKRPARLVEERFDVTYHMACKKAQEALRTAALCHDVERLREIRMWTTVEADAFGGPRSAVDISGAFYLAADCGCVAILRELHRWGLTPHEGRMAGHIPRGELVKPRYTAAIAAAARKGNWLAEAHLRGWLSTYGA